MTTEPFRAAQSYVAAGMSVLPILRGGSKKPTLPAWKEYETRLPTWDELQKWYDIAIPPGVAIIGGKVSGNLEQIDFDHGELFAKWKEIVDAECYGLTDSLNVVQTPREPCGYHARYRCSAITIPGNLKLAQDEAVGDDGKKKVTTLIETRGEGGYALAPGSPAECHENQRTYDYVSGPPLESLSDVTGEQRQLLIDVCRLFDRLGIKDQAPAAQTVPEGSSRPGDDFNRRGPDWQEILEPHGWRCLYSIGAKRCWKRPGKKTPGVSATTGHCSASDGSDFLYVFSSNAHPFNGQGGKNCFTKFQAFALLNHGGDYSVAASDLAGKGFGDQRNGKPHPGLKASAKAFVGTSKVPAPQEVQPGESVITLAKDITVRKVEWLWPGRIPLGKLTTFAGNGGLGKTFVLTDIASRVTRGLEWPDGSVNKTEGRVLYISGEDDPDDTLVPRLMASGADLSRVAFLVPAKLGKFTLADLPLLTQAVIQLGKDAKLVAIDPPTAYLGGVNDHKNSELRQLLTPLSEWAKDHRVAVVFITHVNKPQAAKTDAIMRVLGSVAWTNAVRAAHMFAKDPEDGTRRLFVGMKNNLGKERKGLAYKLVQVDESDEDSPARVEWLGEVDISADEAVNKELKSKKRDVVAADWLIERFREKLEWKSDDLFEMGKQHGISKSAIWEAKNKLNLPRAKPVTYQDGSKHFFWWVPQDWQHFQLSRSTTETVETVETVPVSVEF